IELADDPRADVFTPIIELLLKLVLDYGAFLLDDEDFFETLGKTPDALAFQRPGHRNFVKPKADFGGMRIVNAEIVERLTHVQVGFPSRDDTEPRPRAVDDDAVQPVGACESQRCVKLVLMEPEFLVEGLIGPTDIQPARRHLEILGEHDPGALGPDLDRGRAV